MNMPIPNLSCINCLADEVAYAIARLNHEYMPQPGGSSVAWLGPKDNEVTGSFSQGMQVQIPPCGNRKSPPKLR